MAFKNEARYSLPHTLSHFLLADRPGDQDLRRFAPKRLKHLECIHPIPTLQLIVRQNDIVLV